MPPVRRVVLVSMCWSPYKIAWMERKASFDISSPNEFYTADENKLYNSLRGEYFTIRELLLDLALAFQDRVENQDEGYMELEKQLNNLKGQTLKFFFWEAYMKDGRLVDLVFGPFSINVWAVRRQIS